MQGIRIDIIHRIHTDTIKVGILVIHDNRAPVHQVVDLVEHFCLHNWVGVIHVISQEEFVTTVFVSFRIMRLAILSGRGAVKQTIVRICPLGQFIISIKESTTLQVVVFIKLLTSVTPTRLSRYKSSHSFTKPFGPLFLRNTSFYLGLNQLSSCIQGCLRGFCCKLFLATKRLGHIVEIGNLGILVWPPAHENWTKVCFFGVHPGLAIFKNLSRTVPAFSCQVTIYQFKTLFRRVKSLIVNWEVRYNRCQALAERIGWGWGKGTCLSIEIKHLPINSNSKVLLIRTICHHIVILSINLLDIIKRKNCCFFFLA